MKLSEWHWESMFSTEDWEAEDLENNDWISEDQKVSIKELKRQSAVIDWETEDWECENWEVKKDWLSEKQESRDLDWTDQKVVDFRDRDCNNEIWVDEAWQISKWETWERETENWHSAS